MRKVGDTAQAAGELVTSTLSGDFRPAKELAELATRGAAGIFLGGNPGYGGAARINETAMADVNAQRAARREAGSDADYWRRSSADISRLDAEAARDPSLRGKLTRGGVALGGEALTAALSGGGSIPATMASAGLMELNSPENIPVAAAFGALPLGGRAVRSAAPAVERTLGREAVQDAGGLIRLSGAAVDEAAIRAAAVPMQAIAKAVERSPWQDTVLAYYRANLLTNPVGRAADLGSTVINQFADAAARPIAAAVDTIVSKGTGARSITGPSLRGTGRAFGSIGQGFRDAGKVLKTGAQAIESGADDVLYGAEIRSGLGKVADVPVNGVFRLLGALDAPFRRFGFTRNLYDRAKVAALNEVKRDLVPRGQLTARVRELLDDESIIRAAVRDGEAAVLSEPNRISSWLASQTANSANARLALGIVQPFMRIPLNAVLKAADFAGLGGVKAMYKIARGVGRKAQGKSFFRDLEDQRAFSMNVAAGSFAPAGFLLGMELEERGKMEGFYFTSKRDFPNGKVPTSININGENFDINRLGGFIAAPLFIGATYNRLRKQDVGKANALLRSFSGLVQTAPALGYYGVPAKAGRLLTADEPGNVMLQEAGSTASGFIPASGLAGAAAKALDPEKRRETEGFTGPILNRIPILRQQLPVKETRRRR